MSQPAPTDETGNPIDLPAVLAAHRRWRETNGADGQFADLRGAYLRDANLRYADLRGAYLRDANLCDADLRYADLRDADLRYADLRDADLRGAYLRDANLCDADLRYADLRDADLRGADLRGANLCDADLRYADLCGASGCILLTETDHGYHVVAGFREGEWRIWAGCRDFTISEARKHWGAPDYHTPLSGRRVVACLDWLETEIANGLVIGGAE